MKHYIIFALISFSLCNYIHCSEEEQLEIEWRSGPQGKTLEENTLKLFRFANIEAAEKHWEIRALQVPLSAFETVKKALLTNKNINSFPINEKGFTNIHAILNNKNPRDPEQKKIAHWNIGFKSITNGSMLLTGLEGKTELPLLEAFATQTPVIYYQEAQQALLRNKFIKLFKTAPAAAELKQYPNLLRILHFSKSEV